MRRSIVPALAMFVLLVVGACGASTSTASAPSQPAPSQPAASQPAASQPAPSVATTACKPATEPVANPVVVSIAGRAYDPDPVQATVGQAIEWHNEDAVPHTATLDDADCDTGQLIRGQSGALVFAEAGTYAYHCTIHASMHGTITIAP